MGLNGAKTCQNRAAGTTGPGTTLTYTGTGYPMPVSIGTTQTYTGTDCPLHPCTGTAQPVPVHPTGFCPKMRDFAFLTHFSSTNLLQFFPYQKSTMESTQKQLQKWFSTDCPLHPCTGTAQPVPVHPTGFCPKMRDFAFLTHFSSTNLLQFFPHQKSTMESTQKQLQKWFRLNKNSFLSS